MNHSEKKDIKNLTNELFAILGTPFSNENNLKNIQDFNIDKLFDFAFKNRVALLMFEKCEANGIHLSNKSLENFNKLKERRKNTDKVLLKITHLLDKKYKNQWAFFKTIKPFSSTPNDTDWFPFDTKKHKEMCDVLLENGFEFLENAPLQLTLIDKSGSGIANSDKRGGVWYIDCYRAPGADYFKYLDPKKMENYLERTVDNIKDLPILGSEAELCAICFHNVFPEKTYSIESFYLILHYLLELETNNKISNFVNAAKDNHVTKAISVNFRLTAALHLEHFGYVPEVLQKLIEEFDQCSYEEKHFKTEDCLPYNFSLKAFWSVFFEKLYDPISLKSLFVQFFHMLNPIFFAGVVKIIWQRSKKGGIYKQM